MTNMNGHPVQDYGFPVKSPSHPSTGEALLTQIRISVVATLALAVLVSGIYPLLVWGLAQVLYPDKANGSLLRDQNGQIVGSALLAQSFTSPRYFHPRPSAAGSGYDAASSGGTNLGPTSDKLINGIHKKTADGKDDPGNFDGVKDLAAAYRQENSLDATTPIPADAVTRSGSGLDPHISVRNAQLQAARVAKARGISEDEVRQDIERHTENPDLRILGEPRINVLLLNRALDSHEQAPPPATGPTLPWRARAFLPENR
jgi:potassium-transporting ATPase KdpC subunit